jgi:hypothetical protein
MPSRELMSLKTEATSCFLQSYYRMYVITAGWLNAFRCLESTQEKGTE